MIQEKSFLQKSNLLKLAHVLIRVCFQKRKPRAIRISTKKWPYKWKCANEPQSYLKFLFSCNNPHLECFYLSIKVGSADMNNVFWLPSTFVTWDSKVTSTQRPFWEHQSTNHFNIMTWIQDHPHPRWIVPYIFGQGGEGICWRVCYQQGLPYLV